MEIRWRYDRRHVKWQKSDTVLVRCSIVPLILPSPDSKVVYFVYLTSPLPLTLPPTSHTMTTPTDPGLTVPLLINGREETTPKTFPVISPYTNKPIWNASAATPEDAIRAVEAADAAFPAWSQTKPTARRDILLKAADLLEARLKSNAEYMRQEMGADVGASAGFVVPLAVRMLRDVASRITSICGSVPVVETEGQSAMVFKEAMGVILGIVPW
jgi:delta 1-pyrroline-5-carboxylate dehydrogenase